MKKKLAFLAVLMCAVLGVAGATVAWADAAGGGRYRY